MSDPFDDDEPMAAPGRRELEDDLTLTPPPSEKLPSSPEVARSISKGLFGLFDLAHDKAAQITGFGWGVNPDTGRKPNAKTREDNWGFTLTEKEATYFQSLADEMAKYLPIESLGIIFVVGAIMLIEAGKFMAWRKWKTPEKEEEEEPDPDILAEATA